MNGQKSVNVKRAILWKRIVTDFESFDEDFLFVGAN
jgi:hypothetical protein